MLDHEQRRRTILELFAFVHADVAACLAAARAETLGLRQFMMPGFARQMLGQAAAAVRLAAALGLLRFLPFGRRRRVRGRDQLGEQQELVGVETLAARPVQAAQQHIEPVPQRVVVALVLVQRGHQFQDQALKGGDIDRQVLGGERRQHSRRVGEAHTV